MTGARVRLVDEADRGGRTTATLLASLGGRLASLHAVTGADAVGAFVSGLAALGRDAACTAPGARLRSALAAGRPGATAQRLWSALLIDRWTSALPPSPVLDHLRNDLALLLADDVAEFFELPPALPEPSGPNTGREPQETTALDVIVGMWVFAQELTAAVEALAEPTLPGSGQVVSGPDTPPPTAGPLLR